MNWMIISKIVKEAQSFKVYSRGVFTCVVLILSQDGLAVVGYIFSPCFDTFGYYGEPTAE